MSPGIARVTVPGMKELLAHSLGHVCRGVVGRFSGSLRAWAVCQGGDKRQKAGARQIAQQSPCQRGWKLAGRTGATISAMGLAICANVGCSDFRGKAAG